jgi:hypothetical protein
LEVGWLHELVQSDGRLPPQEPLFLTISLDVTRLRLDVRRAATRGGGGCLAGGSGWCDSASRPPESFERNPMGALHARECLADLVASPGLTRFQLGSDLHVLFGLVLASHPQSSEGSKVVDQRILGTPLGGLRQLEVGVAHAAGEEGARTRSKGLLGGRGRRNAPLGVSGRCRGPRQQGRSGDEQRCEAAR